MVKFSLTQKGKGIKTAFEWILLSLLSTIYAFLPITQPLKDDINIATNKQAI